MAKFLILSASVGAGHVRAGQALERVLGGGANPAGNHEVTHADALAYTHALFRNCYNKGYLAVAHRAPNALGWMFDRLNTPFKTSFTNDWLNRVNSLRLLGLIRRHQPDVIACTHFLASAVVATWKRQGKVRAKLAVIVTDLDAHAFWLARGIDRYFVSLEQTSAYLQQLGVAAGNITVSGIPIDPAFERLAEPAAARKQLELDPHRPIILVSAGGLGFGPMENVITKLLELSQPAQLVAICGRNQRLKASLERLAAAKAGTSSAVSLKPIGFTDRMHDYMAAADLLLGKPGGLTTAEALASGLPMIVVDPMPGQEERNSDHLLEAGAAIRCNDRATIPYKIDRLLGDRERMARMKAAASRLGHPHAAREVAAALTAMV